MKTASYKVSVIALLSVLSFVVTPSEKASAQLNQGNLHIQLTRSTSGTKGAVLRWTDKLIKQLLTTSTEGDDEDLAKRFAALQPNVQQSLNIKPSVDVRQSLNKKTQKSYYYVSFTCYVRDAETNKYVVHSSCTLKTKPEEGGEEDDPYSMNPSKEAAMRRAVITGMGQVLGKMEEKFARDAETSAGSGQSKANGSSSSE